MLPFTRCPGLREIFGAHTVYIIYRHACLRVECQVINVLPRYLYIVPTIYDICQLSFEHVPGELGICLTGFGTSISVGG